MRKSLIVKILLVSYVKNWQNKKLSSNKLNNIYISKDVLIFRQTSLNFLPLFTFTVVEIKS